jgi:hypothetical protein
MLYLWNLGCVESVYVTWRLRAIVFSRSSCDLRGELLYELRSRYAINIPDNTTVDFADFYLKIIIFHWDAVPLKACCVYRVHELWCGKGTRYRLIAYQHGGTPLESCELADASGSA